MSEHPLHLLKRTAHRAVNEAGPQTRQIADPCSSIRSLIQQHLLHVQRGNIAVVKEEPVNELLIQEEYLKQLRESNADCDAFGEISL